MEDLLQKIPLNRLYTREHIWLSKRGHTYTLGLTYFGQISLGEVRKVEMAHTDERLARGDELATIQTATDAYKVKVPVSGTLFNANPALIASPCLVNTDPNAKGWIAMMRIDDLSELASLMSPEEYVAWLLNEASSG